MSEYKRKYEWYRHHAWAGLGLLSVFLAIRYFIFLPNLISLPIVFALIFYILVSLAYTYKYSVALSKEASDKLEKERIKAEIEKARLKLEKKRLKAQIKARKKEEKD